MAGSGVDVSPAPRDPVLEAEGAFLEHVGECLAHMRGTAEALVDVGGDAYASERLGALRAERLRSLAELPDVPAFFGRIDQPERALHIGRRHVIDEAGDPQVIDWRAPVSRTYYQASAQDPQGLLLRRRFGFSRGELTSYEDEDLTRTAPSPIEQDDDGDGTPALGSLVVAEIERPRSGPMRDIVATIQPDQDDIVRAPLEESVCIQGAPGTGKTAVGLHRAAFLLYSHAERLRRGGVLVVGPNRAFLSYIDQVLPALGEVDVTQCTVADLGPDVTVRATDTPAAEAVKTDPRMAEVLARALMSGVREPNDADDVVLDLAGRRYRVRAHRVAATVRTLAEKVVAPAAQREIYYAAARTRLARAIAEDARRQGEAAGFTPTDGETARAARSKDVRAVLDVVWPARRAVDVLADLYSDPTSLARAAEGLLDTDEQAALTWTARPRSLARAPWTAADVVLLDEIEGLLERPEAYEHIVVDEAQDLTAMQCRAIGRRLATGSLTVLGDLAQATHPCSLGQWSTVMTHLGRPEATVRPLTMGYRVPGEVIDFAAQLLPSIAPGLPAPRAARRAPGALRLRPAGDLLAAVVELADREGSTAVICADDAVASTTATLAAAGVGSTLLGSDEGAVAKAGDVVVVPAGLAKGLEHDHVVVLDPADILAAEPRGLQRLYVVLTRAVTSLTVVGAEGLPAPLSPGAPAS
ncbi:DNA helicase IV [Quadrisphaera granulorum]|uniref:DNA helicase IV n=1 Tax=Quadrisphaera granulorum TaxID=317664 RepID=A0A315ZPU6_9ACTN|nr:AAA family ATPase [Quadrisphaera granulorum]PWJ46918.1 DNA helicase IV [Quadrisphaera granulorum]SZE99010.1 DNA helicase IV [Quadrisphaera granulorum]